MAIKLGGGGGGEELGVNGDINVTPFIDVTLVLLIIFMVAAPLSTVDAPVDLPTSNAAAQPHPDKPIYLTVRRDLTLAIGETSLRLEDLQAKLDAESGGDRARRIFLRGDKGLSYGDLMGVMNGLRDAGYLKIALVGVEGAPATRAAP